MERFRTTGPRPVLIVNAVLAGFFGLLLLLGVLSLRLLTQSYATFFFRGTIAFFFLAWLLVTRPRGELVEGTGLRWRLLDGLALLSIAGFALWGFAAKDGPRQALTFLADGSMAAFLLLLFIREGMLLLGPKKQADLFKQRIRIHRAYLLDWLVVPLFIFNTFCGLRIITILTPLVYDPVFFEMDAVILGAHLDQLISNLPDWLAWVLVVTYDGLPVYLMIVLLYLYLTGGYRAFRRLLLTFVLIGFTGWLCYLLVPVVGPYFYYNFLYPDSPLQAKGPQFIQKLLELSSTPQPFPRAVARNCIPSLHTAWAVVLLLAAWLQSRKLFLILLLPVLGTIAATVLLAHHYVIDVLLAVPFVALIWSAGGWVQQALESRRRPPLTVYYLVLLAASAAFCLAMVFLYRWSQFTFWSFWITFVVLVGVVCYSAVRIQRSPGQVEDAPPGESTEAPGGAGFWGSLSKSLSGGGTALKVVGLFFLSGFSGLVYEVVFARELALIFGSTGRAATTVLAVYMAGLALGAYLGGVISDRVKNPLKYYAIMELLVGCLCFAAPWLFDATNYIYLHLARTMGLAGGAEAFLQVGCGSIVVLLPAVLMGTTMPLLAKHITPQLDSLRRNIALLYSANTLGAAIGTIVTGYFLISSFGISYTLRLATMLNFLVALIAYRMAAGTQPRAGPAPEKLSGLRWGGSYGVILVIAAGLVGFISFGLEVLYFHLLAVVAGNSVYAFSLMLFSFLIGLGCGSLVISRWRVSGHFKVIRLSLSAMALGTLIILFLPLWDNIPPFLGQYANVHFARTFEEREFIRFLVCFSMMIGPTFLIGMIFPQLVDLSTSSVDALGRHVGLVSFSNTLGNILGAVIAGLVLIAWLGSYRAILSLGMAAVLVGALLAVGIPGPRRWIACAGGGLLTVVLFLVAPGQWNLTALTMGANVYFRPQSYGEPIEMGEELDGGITTLTRREMGGKQVLTMLTNGKFQGDDGPEMKAQFDFAMYPLLHCRKRDRALIIGLGTGVSARVVRDAGFNELHVAELSAEVVRMAAGHFGHVNGKLMADPRVQVFVTDGRNLLEVREETYDLISMEISSIWFAGAANLYNREFYQIASRRLGEDGVLQQWIQLHHIGILDMASILASVHSVFDQVWLYFGGQQGVIVAAKRPAPLDYQILQELEEHPALAWVRERTPRKTFLTLPGEQILDTRGIREFLLAVTGQLGLEEAELQSTDDNRLLEYSTPKGNVRDYAQSLRSNLEILYRFRTPGTGQVSGVPPQARDLIRGARLLGQRRETEAREFLQPLLQSPSPRVREVATRLLGD